MNLILKAAAICCACLAFSLPAYSEENPQSFEDIFSDDYNDDFRSFRNRDERSKSYDFDAPHFSRRAKGKNTITAKVDLSEQKMRVFINNKFWQEWKVSSGGKGHRTPTGKYRPTRLHEKWFSRTYYNSPMPHSVFFHHGYAIHATTYLRSLGRPASHGCVRLHPQHAKAFFNLVQEFGSNKTRIIITR